MPSTEKVPFTKGFRKIHPYPLRKEEHDSSGALRKKSPNLGETRLRFERWQETDMRTSLALPFLPCLMSLSFPFSSSHLWGGSFFRCEGYPFLLPLLYRAFAISFFI